MTPTHISRGGYYPPVQKIAECGGTPHPSFAFGKIHLPLKGKAEWLNLAGWDYNPSVTFGDTSPQGEVICLFYTSSEEEGDHRRWWRRDYTLPVAMVPQNPPFSFYMYPHFFDSAKKRRYPPKKRFPTPAVCSRKRCPLHKGTKTLHHKNGGSDSRPPSFRPTAVFILHLPPGCFRLFFNRMGLQSLRHLR